MPATLPHPARSYAVIIGASEYQDKNYPEVNAIAHSAERFRSLISTERMWRLPPDNVAPLTGKVSVAEAAEAIERAASRHDVDGLFIYLCMHGRRWTEDHVPDRDLHFALSDSVWNRSFTHLPFQWVRWQLTHGSTAATTVLIIDSCWSDDTYLGLSAEQPQPLRIPGKCTMTATKERRPADTSWHGTDYTAFSGALIEVIEKGIREQGEYLTPKTVFDALLKKLANNHPEPGIRTDASGDDVFLCRNKKFKQVANNLPVDKLLATLDTPQATDLAVYATAVEDACDPDFQPDTVRRLINEFGEKRPAQEVIRLANLLRSRDVSIVNEQADLLIEHYYASRNGADIAGLLDQLHGHDSDDVNTDEVLRALANRPPQITADVSASLRKARCSGCAAIGRRIDNRMLDVWPSARHAELLAVLH